MLLVSRLVGGNKPHAGGQCLPAGWSLALQRLPCRAQQTAPSWALRLRASLSGPPLALSPGSSGLHSLQSSCSQWSELSHQNTPVKSSTFLSSCRQIPLLLGRPNLLPRVTPGTLPAPSNGCCVRIHRGQMGLHGKTFNCCDQAKSLKNDAQPH